MKLKEVLISIAFSLFLVIGFNQVFALITVEGISMGNSLKDKTIHLTLRTHFMGDLDRGDVIFFEGNIDGEKMYVIKRIVAVPGDKVAIKDNQIFINGMKLEESYINEPMTETEDMEEITVKLNEFFVMGDNRNHSIDSRNFGPVPIRAIRGKLIM